MVHCIHYHQSNWMVFIIFLCCIMVTYIFKNYIMHTMYFKYGNENLFFSYSFTTFFTWAKLIWTHSHNNIHYKKVFFMFSWTSENPLMFLAHLALSVGLSGHDGALRVSQTQKFHHFLSVPFYCHFIFTWKRRPP